MAESVTPPHRRLEVGPAQDRIARDVLGSGGVMSITHQKPDGSKKTHFMSGLDVRIPENATSEELTQWAGAMLSLTETERVLLVEKPQSPEAKKLYERIDRAYQDGLNHLQKELYLEYDAEKTFGVPRIRNINDIHKMMRGSSSYLGHKSTDREKEQSLRFCDALCHAVAAYELQDSGIKDYVLESEYVSRAFKNADESRNLPPLFIDAPSKGFTTHLMILDTFAIAYNPALHGQGTVSVGLLERGKKDARVHSKIVRDPQVRAEEASKDALGLRLIVKETQGASAAMQLLSRIFGEPFVAENVVVENDGFFENEEADTFRENLNREFPHNTKIISEPANASSAGFTTLKIRAQILVPQGGTGAPVRRSIEIQIIPVHRSAETGPVDHAVFELVQKVAEVTRSHTYVPLQQFSMYINDVVESFKSRGQNITEKEVVNWIQGRIAFVAGKNKQATYPVHVGETKRLSNFGGLVNTEWIDAVLHAAGRDANRGLLKAIRKYNQESKG